MGRFFIMDAWVIRVLKLLMNNNAGILRDKTLVNMEPENWDAIMDVHLKGAYNVTRPASVKMRENRYGRIVFTTSAAGLYGNFGQTNYAASKAGVLGYVRSSAGTLGKSGITINAVAPGYVDTRMTRTMPFATREMARRFNALSQGGVTQDIAEAITFLASPGAQGISGSLLRVCGLNLLGA